MLVFTVVVGGDIAGANVRILADGGVAHVGEVGDLAACAERRVLRFGEGADARVRMEVGPCPQVCEGPGLCAGVEHRVGQDAVRTGLGTRGETRCAPKDREGVDDAVGGQRDGRVDVGRGRVNDARTGQEMLFDDAGA